MTSSSLTTTRLFLKIGFAGALLAAQAGTAHAAGGLFEVLGQIFAPQPTYRSVPPSMYAPQRPYLARPRRAAPSRNAGLPSTKPNGAHRVKGAPRPPGSDPLAELMSDPTLRRGDIVILRRGAMVFRGGAGPHEPADFEDARRSTLLGERTRRDLLALRLQPAANPKQASTAAPAPGEAAAREDEGGLRIDVTGSAGPAAAR